jgi:hypothetical protein
MYVALHNVSKSDNTHWLQLNATTNTMEKQAIHHHSSTPHVLLVQLVIQSDAKILTENTAYLVWSTGGWSSGELGRTEK